MAGRMVRMEDHETVGKKFNHRTTYLPATSNPSGGSRRSQFPKIKILAIPCQQVHIVHRQLSSVPVRRFSSIERGQE